MSDKSAVVFGAGRIARGFVGHLLGLDGYRTTFVDVDPELVSALNDAGRYTVHIMGAPERSSVVEDVSALLPDSPDLAERLTNAEVVFVSVGGANLASVAKSLASGLLRRLDTTNDKLNIIVCENWPAAGRTLRDALAASWADLGREFPVDRVGVAESTIMRSAVDASPEQLAADPLAKQSQDYWSLPVDEAALVTELRGPRHVEPVAGFANALQRKLFTYNGANAIISYLGMVAGHELLSEAANDPDIAEVARAFHHEIGAAMVRTFGFDQIDQDEYAARALAKFQDRSIVDPLRRQVRDPMRKLSHDDRLVGAALFTLSAGITPDNAALGIRAALEYRDESDPSAVEMAGLVAREGVPAALAHLGELAADHPLIDLVMSRSGDLARFRSHN